MLTPFSFQAILQTYGVQKYVITAMSKMEIRHWNTRLMNWLLEDSLFMILANVQ